jgi:hypothetical protein
VTEFIAYTGLLDHTALRTVLRSHVIAWRDHPSKTLSIVVALRLSLRAQRRPRQSRGWREAPGFQ